MPRVSSTGNDGGDQLNYSITHTTQYRYSSLVSVCHNVVTLCPLQNSNVKRHQFRLSIKPEPEVTAERVDMFGNVIQRFSLEESHSELTITATSRVSILPRESPSLEDGPSCADVVAAIADRSNPNWLQVIPFTYNSPRIRRSSEFSDYAGGLHKSRSVLKAAMDLTNKIYTEFEYDKDATQVDTPTKTAFDGRHGVCQDFAHIAITCLRSMGIPSRYVSGYLRTVPPPGKQRLVGSDQSHAWLSVYAGPELGWIDFDPTNDCLCGTDHIPIAVGRDYSDVVPIKGVFLGGGDPSLSVSVDVKPETSATA